MAGRWLLKTEPEEWSWEHQQANGGVSNWDGVRNALAQKHLRAMAIGDLCFFYHSGAKAKEIVGTARVCKTFYPDPSDPASKHGMVDIEAVSKFALPLSLARLKQEDGLHSFIMFRQPRLSVVPVSSSEWDLICKLAGEIEPPSLPLDTGDGYAQASSDDNGNVRMDVGTDGVSLSDMADKPSLPFSRGKQQRTYKAKSSIDGSKARTTQAELTVQKPRPHSKVRVADTERAPNKLAEDSLDNFKFNEEKSSKVHELRPADPELAINSKRVYSRRKRMPRLCADEGETPASHENAQSRTEQEAGEELLPTITESIDSRIKISDAGRVYKKRERRQKFVESLL